MKKLIGALSAAALLLTVGSAGALPAASESSGVADGTAHEDLWLSLSTNTTGARYFVDVNGEPVQLFGMARCQLHRDGEDILFSTTESVNALAQHYADFGMNFMRLAIDLTELEQAGDFSPDAINRYITDKIDGDVQAIIRAGMYVMLDLHMYPPDTLKNGAEKVQYAYDHYIPFLVELAKKYADEPRVAVLELWNEPFPADQEELNEDQENWNKLVRQFFIDAVAEVRKYDKRHVLLVSDWNAGWGAALPDTWNGYYDTIDPECNNTAFSVHTSAQQLDVEYEFYSQWYRNTAIQNNICLIFGEIETEEELMTTKGMQNLLKIFDDNAESCHFSGVLWRPHPDFATYVDVWSDWVKEYATPSPAPSSRFVVEAENFADTSEEIAVLSYNSDLFGSYVVGTGIVLNANLPANRYYEGSRLNNEVYPAGDYTLTVGAYGDPVDSGGFIVGYRTTSGDIRQIASFEGSTTAELYYQTVSFTAEEPIVSLVYFGTDSTRKSVAIDRAVLSGRDGMEATKANKVTISDVAVIYTLDGQELDPAADMAPSESSTGGTESTAASGSGTGLSSMTILMIVMCSLAVLIFAALGITALVLRKKK